MALSDTCQNDTRHHDDNDGQCGDASPISINRLAILHSREALLVHPLIWTYRQLTVFGCRIRFRGEGGVEGRDDRDDRKCVSPKLVALLDHRLNRPLRGNEFQHTIWKLLGAFSDLNVSVDLGQKHEVYFYFNQRPKATIRFYYFKIRALPVACIEANENNRLRYAALSNNIRQGPVPNWPGIYRRNVRYERCRAPSPEQDPYLVALVIGLAQKKRGGVHETHRPARGYYTVRVVFTGKELPSPLNVFVAHVTPAFLERLDFPAQAPPVTAGLDIHHWRISPHPFETLPHRLIRCLGRECCGETHADDRSSAGARERLAKKRKRDADPGCPEEPSPKR